MPCELGSKSLTYFLRATNLFEFGSEQELSSVGFNIAQSIAII